jgi:ATP-binding protein involved in chromosome partitioning
MQLGKSRSDPDLAGLRAALGAVADPETGRSLGELGMLGEVGLGGGARLRVAVELITRDYAHHDELAAALTVAAGRLEPDRKLSVEFSSMPERRRVEVAERLRAGSARLGGSLDAHTRIYAVASGKGGVGKSTVTANLAAALAAAGQRVGVLDADVWGSSIPQLFGIRRSPVALGGVMLPVVAGGVSLMSVGFFVAEDEPVVWRGPMLHKALEQFLSDVAWGELDVLLLDLPPGTGDITLSLLELAPDAALLAVTTPQHAARSVASRVVRMAGENGMPIAGVIENMAAAHCAACGHESPVFGSGGGGELAERAEAPLLGSIPLDVELRESGDRGVPVVTCHPEAASAQALAGIAAALPSVRRSLTGRSLPLSVAS